MGDEKKSTKTSKSQKPTPGSTMGSKLRSQRNDLTKEERSAAHSRAMTRIYGAKAQHLDKEIEEPLTIEELDRRSEELRSGRVKGIPAEKMIALARQRLGAW